MRMTLLVHIAAGALGLLSGYVALYAAKGAPLHRKSGILFVYVMATMAITGMLISAVEGVAPAINVPSALLTFYLVIIASVAFFPRLGRLELFPKPLLALPVLLPIFIYLFWLWRLRPTRSSRRTFGVSAPEAA